MTERFRALAWQLVRNAPQRHSVLEDLVSEAWIAVLLATRKWSSSPSWARVRARAVGAMRDCLRKERQGGLTWVAHSANVLQSLDAMTRPDDRIRPFGRASVVVTSAANTRPVSAAYKRQRAAQRRAEQLCRDCPNYAGATVLCAACRQKQARKRVAA